MLRPATHLAAILLASFSAIAAADDPDQWSFLPPTRPEIPAVADASWPRNPIDHFLLAELEAFDVPPAPEADRATLLRRLTFDLTGLPPTPEEVEAFLNDPSPFAYEAQVDRLLASPRYGERMAQHWLDLARYADTDGFEFDHTRPDMWRYRDWVVSAFNHDLPYDRFLALQMAADELEPDNPAAAVATGFHRCYPDMVDMNDQGERRQIALDDITETTGLAVLGLTIGCARCHDHKFDPLSQVDFYRLQAFFTPSRFDDAYPVSTPAQERAHDAAVRSWQGELAALRASILRLEADARETLAPGPPRDPRPNTQDAFATPAEDRTPDQIRIVYDALAKDPRIDPARLDAALGPDRLAERNALRAQLDSLAEAGPPPLPVARVLVEDSPDAAPTHLLLRGQYGKPGPEVEPGFPSQLDPSDPRIVPTAHSTGRRSALAAWLTQPDHPLTARVFVNRLWQLHFGRGIVATPSDFGVMGTYPSHPDLLDWLATELPNRGWSITSMQRLIVTSAAYRMSSQFDADSHAIDPDNELFWRQNRRRLDGEAIRDALLASSGLLNPAQGGPPIFPELPEELTKLSSQGAIWPVSPTPAERNRRSLYVFIRRNLRYPFFEAFDRPDTNASCPGRDVTTIAPQALALLNDRLAHDAASSLADRLSHTAGPVPEARIRLAYLLTLGRAPDPSELRLALRYVSKGEETGWNSFCLALLNLNEFVFLD